ncbi:MAG TPA: DUF1802 family protein [Nitrososphaeraceae archaeon]|jgi:hypothetical protein
MNSEVFLPALKEWAIICKALEEGKQIMLLRKGGILEYKDGFKLDYEKFLLFPTLEHQSTESIRSDYAHNLDTLSWDKFDGKRNLTLFAEVSDIRRISDDSVLRSLEKYHVWNRKYIAMRMKYNPKQSMNMIILRVYKMIHPIQVYMKPEWSGCKSWISIGIFNKDSKIFDFSNPVLEEDKFHDVRRQILEILT